MGKHFEQRADREVPRAIDRLDCGIDGIKAPDVRHVADQILERKSLVVETAAVDEEHSGHSQFRAQRRREFADRCVSIIESQQHRPGRKRVAIGFREHILQTDRSVMFHDKLQRCLELFARDCNSEPFGENRFRIRDLVEEDAAQRVLRTQGPRYAERSGSIPEASGDQIQRGPPSARLNFCVCGKW